MSSIDRSNDIVAQIREYFKAYARRKGITLNTPQAREAESHFTAGYLVCYAKAEHVIVD
jgi:hypothetical protein